MKQYRIYQGTMEKSGMGDLEIDKTFDRLDLATEYFNQIKDDETGWIQKPHGFLETWLEEVDLELEQQFEENDSIDFDSIYKLLASHRHYWNKK